jgi:hypothetical protein
MFDYPPMQTLVVTALGGLGVFCMIRAGYLMEKARQDLQPYILVGFREGSEGRHAFTAFLEQPGVPLRIRQWYGASGYWMAVACLLGAGSALIASRMDIALAAGLIGLITAVGSMRWRAKFATRYLTSKS